MEKIGHDVVQVLLYSFVGIIIFAIAFVVMEKLTPFSVRKEIEEDQNISLSVLMGSVFIGIAIIISAAITG